MAGFDDLIRGAVEKQGNPTAERRATIYESSRQALERMLQQNTKMDEATAKAQRVRLEQAIENVEQGYAEKDEPAPTAPVVPPIPAPAEDPAPAAKPDPAPAPTPAAAPASTPAPVPPPTPKLKPEEPKFEEPAPAVQPAAPPAVPAAPPAAAPVSNSVEAPLHLEPEIAVDTDSNQVPVMPDNYRGNAFDDRKPYAKLLLWTIILAGVGVAIWWGVTFGPAFLQKQFDGSVPNPSPTIESGSFIPSEGNGWISAFNPREDAQNIVSANRGSADLIRNGDNQFLRIASNTGSTQNNLRIVVPRGVMESIKGKSATFELMIKNSGKSEHQFAVFCEFGEMGNCGRKRFRANAKVEAFIFDALINDTNLAEGTDAYLDINTDLSNDGKSVDLYSVRVRPG